MAGALVTMTGLGDVQKLLRESPKHIVVVGYAKALNAGAVVIEQTLQVMTPESGIDRENRLPLAESIVIEVEVDTEGKGGVAEVGFGANGYIANMVEYGHRMVTHAPGKKQVGDVPAHPFIRPAFDQSAEAAIAAFAASIEQTVRQEYP